MRAIYSYGVALIIVLVLAVWLGSGMLVTGGNGPGNGVKPVVAVIEKDGGPLTSAVEGSGINNAAEDGAGVDPTLTIAQRVEEQGNGANATPRSVRIEVIKAQNMPIEVSLRGKTQAKATVSVVAQTSGIVQAVNVIKGQSVKAGEVICTLDQGARKLSVEQAQAALDQAQNAFDANQELVKKGVSTTNSALSAAASLKSAQASLESAQLELDRTEIKTNVDGVVSDPLANAGSMLATGSPCATVVQLDPMLFVGSVPEAQVGYARLGLPVTVTTITGAKAEGKVSYIASTADSNTRSFPVEIELPNTDGALLDGTTAEAVVNVGSAQGTLLPQSALTLDDNGVLGIRTVEDGNKVAFHAVTIFKDTREGVWVLGLPSTINLITVGQEFVQPGQIVDAKTVDGEPATS